MSPFQMLICAALASVSDVRRRSMFPHLPFQTSAAAGRAPPVSWCPPPWQQHKVLLRSSSPCLFVSSPFLSFLPWHLEMSPSLTHLPGQFFLASSSTLVPLLLLSTVFYLLSLPVSLSVLLLLLPSGVAFAPFHPFCLFLVVALFLTLLLCQTSPFTPFSLGFSPLPLFHLCPGWRVPAPLLLLLKFTSSLSFCGVRDAEKRWSCHLCFLSLLVVATYNAELAAWMSHCIVPPLLPATF